MSLPEKRSLCRLRSLVAIQEISTTAATVCIASFLKNLSLASPRDMSIPLWLTTSIWIVAARTLRRKACSGVPLSQKNWASKHSS